MNNYLIIDKNTLSRKSLISLVYELEENSNVHDAESLRHVFKLNINNQKIDCIIFNPADEHGNYFSYLDNLNRLSPKSKKLLISHHTEYINCDRLIQKGIGAIIPVNSDESEIIYAIRSLINDHTYISPMFLTLKEEHSESKNVKTSITPRRYKCKNEIRDKLTKRQIEVLDYMIKGSANRLIAYELGLSEGTIKLHVSSILKALKVTNRTQAAIRANQLLSTQAL